MVQIPILSDTLTAVELERLIRSELDSSSGISLKIEDEKAGYKGDLAVLVALITGGAALASTVIAQVVTIFLKIYEKRQDRRNSKVVVKGKSGRSIEIPLSATEEEIKKFMALTRQLDEEEEGIKYIATVSE